MTDTVADVAAPLRPSDEGAAAADGDTRRNRALLILSAIAAVVPFFWAAVRDGRNGFYPTLDVAATVLRARATFSAHPPLYGMWSSGSSWAGHEIHFPGPILLYLLAAPVHLLGNTWGTLLGMAVINACFVVVTGWVIYRRLGAHAALLGFLVLNVFTWSIGSENLIDARPMEMVTIPFLCFLLLVWLVTSGEIDALPWLAVVANYLFLNHLVMALQIPVIGLCAAVGVVLWIRRARSRGAAVETDADPPMSLRRLRRRLIQTGIITFVMWLPSLIQQFTHSPGNLNLLITASGRHRDPVGSYTVAYNATMRLIAQPMFWFRGRFDDGNFQHGLTTLAVWDVVTGVIVFGSIIGLGIAARRRRDRLSLSALAVAVVGIAISIETVTQAPAMWGFPLQYLRSLWGLAAFVWFAIAFSAYRALADRFQVTIASVAGVGAVVFGVLALSFANFGSATDMDNAPYARALVDKVVPKLTDRGKVRVVSGPGFTSQRFFSSLLLGLDTAGVHYCVDHHTAQQYGEQHDCARDASVDVFIHAPKPPEQARGEIIARIPLLTESELAELETARQSFDRWLSDRHEVEITPGAWKAVDGLGGNWTQTISELLAPADGDLSGLMDSPAFHVLLRFEALHRSHPNSAPKVFEDRSAPVAAMLRYLQLADPGRHGSIWVYERTSD